ncbi:MAG: xylulokinase [Ktedonobacterales bacterium]|nr:xylulokinase [Ktedonobacterales bacterium]
MADLLMGLDLGTSGVKALLLNPAGSVVASASAEYPLYHPQPGWAEQHPADWWAGTVAAIRACLERAAPAGYAPADVRGLAISGQMHGAVLLDAADAVLRPAIIWADQRTGAECDEITRIVGQERLIDLVSNPALPGFTAPKLLWVRNHEPAVWAQVRHVLLPKDWLRYRLTGTMAQEISDAAGTCLLDVTQGTWSAAVLAALDLAPDLFPPIVGSAVVAGTLTAAAAAATGLPVGLPIAGGGADNACAAVGAGIVQPGQALISIGTSGVVLAYSATPSVDRSGPIPRAHTFNHAVPDAWYLMGVTQGAGLSLRWVRDQLGALEQGQAAATGRDAYAVLTDEAADIPPGSAGLLFLPYLQGERTPILDGQARGGWIGLTAAHTRAHLVRAVLEGVAFSLRDCLGVLQASGVAVTEIRATGGGMRSPLWREIVAAVCGEPLVPLATEEGPALGAALLAGVAVGSYPDIPAACAQVVRLAAPTVPEVTAMARYADLYPLYQGLYPALRVTMHALS